MARFSEVRKHTRRNRGAQRQAERTAVPAENRKPMIQSSAAQRVPGAIKPTAERARGKHQRAYEPDPDLDPVGYAEWERQQEALEAA